MSFLRKILTRLRTDERGVAMVVVMGVLLVTSTLALAVGATAQRSSEGTVRDSNSKRALAAAESGLNVGRFNVGVASGSPGLNDSSCFPTTTPPCGFAPYASDGNGAEFTYRVSATNPTNCVVATPPVTAGLRERCVTAIGRFGGVQRRLQTRIVENRGAPLFPFPGMLGLDRVALNHAAADGTVGTNGQIVVGPNSEILAPARIKLGGGAAQVVPANYATDRRDPSPNPFVLDLYTEWYSASARAPSNGGSTAPPNGNNAIGTLSGMPGFSATSQRQVTLGSGAEVTLAGGSDYNFCSLKMNSDARFVIPATTTQPVRIFIDSSTRPGNPSFVPSGCPAFAGNVVDLASGSGFINQTGKASMLQLFVYGSATENIVFNASANFTGTLWAPRSSVVFNQGATVTGAIAARDIEFRNNSGQPGFIGDPDANNVTGRWDGSYKRSGWRECSPRGNTPGC